MTRILSSSQDRRKMVDVLTVLPPELMAQSANWKILNLNLFVYACLSVSMPVVKRESHSAGMEDGRSLAGSVRFQSRILLLLFCKQGPLLHVGQ